MDIEDLEPRKTKPKPKNLDPLSVDELEDYIRELEEEIARVKGEIAKIDRKSVVGKEWRSRRHSHH